MPTKPVISIVDDDQSVRESTMDLIETTGLLAETFDSAEDFLKSSSLHSTSCLITDVQMPGMTGLELCRHLAESGNGIPTILITAYPDDKDRARATQAGVICYLVKPFNGDDLLACVCAALKPHQADRRRS